MPTIQATESTTSERLTPAEIDRTYQQLGLDDPRVRKFYDQLDQLNRQDEPLQYWIQTHIHSNIPTTDR